MPLTETPFRLESDSSQRSIGESPFTEQWISECLQTNIQNRPFGGEAEKFAQAASLLTDSGEPRKTALLRAGRAPQSHNEGSFGGAVGRGHILELIRQNSRLAFVNTLLSRVGGCLELCGILSNVSRVLESFSLHLDLGLLLWERNGSRVDHADIFLPQALSRKEEMHWTGELVQAGQQILEQELGNVRLVHFNGRFSPGRLSAETYRYWLPLEENGVPFGLFLFCEQPSPAPVIDMSLLCLAVRQLSPLLSGAVKVSRLQHMADYDPLTALPNRRHFHKRLTEEIKRHQRQNRYLSLIMLDLDDFKAVNDSYGHQAGDALLQEIGRTIVTTARETDVAARYGGEEFVILLPETSEREAEILAARLASNFASRKSPRLEPATAITFSLGIASIRPEDEPDGMALIQRADQALYSAKQSGKNTCHLYSDIDKKILIG